MPHTFFNDLDRESILLRIAKLKEDSPRKWGTMTPPRMIAHLTDQMRHCLGDVPVKPHINFLRLAPVRFAAIYLVPWPKGRVQGPPEAFVSSPGDWTTDIEQLQTMVRRFAMQDPNTQWPPHLLFGTMRGVDWGVFCYKHFDHHLRQFGV